MQRNRLVYAAVGATVLLFIVAAWILFSGSNGGSHTAGPSGEQPRASNFLSSDRFLNWEQNGMQDEDLRRLASSLFAGDDFDYRDMLEQTRSGHVDLVSELWRLRRMCGEKLSQDECNLVILQYIHDRVPAPDNAKLVEVYKQYLAYEQAMLSFEMPRGLSPEEQYDLVREKRRELFGMEDADLVFGYEETERGYAQEYAEFVKSTEGMSGDARMAAFQEMRKKHWGRYYGAMSELEPAFEVYSVELELREQDLGKLPEDARDERIRAIRTEYFGPDGAERMAAVDQQLEEESAAEEAYRKARADFLRNNPDLDEASREARLAELRLKHFGSKEAADAFARREALMN